MGAQKKMRCLQFKSLFCTLSSCLRYDDVEKYTKITESAWADHFSCEIVQFLAKSLLSHHDFGKQQLSVLLKGPALYGARCSSISAVQVALCNTNVISLIL